MFDPTFKAIIDNTEKEFEIKPASIADQREAQKIYNQTFSDAVSSGSIVRARLDDLLKEQKLWDDNKQKKFLTIQRELLDNEKKLARGGISLKQAKAIAVEMKRLRIEMRDLIAVKTNLDSHTAEGQADNARFNYLVSACVVYKDTKEKVFKNYEDYLNRSTELVALLGAQKLAAIMYGLDGDFEKKLPENKFLLKYKLVNDSLDYVDSQGRLVDEKGRLVDSQGRFINEKGEYIDEDGNVVNDKGDYLVQFEPFLDDNGNPISTEDSNDQKPTTEQPQT
jgi:hypothetical protein